jgi:hypothetical protein
VVRDRWEWRGSRHVRHPRPRPQEVPLKVRYPGRAIAKAVLGDDVLLARRERSLGHVRLHCSLSTNDVATAMPLRVHLVTYQKFDCFPTCEIFAKI